MRRLTRPSTSWKPWPDDITRYREALQNLLAEKANGTHPLAWSDRPRRRSWT